MASTQVMDDRKQVLDAADLLARFFARWVITKMLGEQQENTQWMNKSAVAEYIGVDRKTIDQRIKDAGFPEGMRRPGDARGIYWAKNEVDKWIDAA